MEQTLKRVTRSSTNRMIAGVCGGIAEYAGWDPVLTRVLYIALTILSFGFGGVLLYLAAWIILPVDVPGVAQPIAADYPVNGRKVIGILLIVIGAIAILPSHFHWFWGFHHARAIGPVLLIAAGIALLCNSAQKKTENSAQISDAVYTNIDTEERTSNMPQDSTQTRRLERSRTERKIAGICGGFGNYFNLDPTLVRLLWIVSIFAFGTGFLLYLVLWIIMPLEAEK
jgi:phage shock protein C